MKIEIELQKINKRLKSIENKINPQIKKSRVKDITSSVISGLKMGGYKPHGTKCWYAEREGRSESDCCKVGCDCLYED